MKYIFEKIIRNIATNPVFERLVIWFTVKFLGFNRDAFQKAGLNYGLVLPITVNDELATLLDEIPSETSQNERRFLYKFFSTIWGGKNNIIEIGSFLGGTSRAIALGMIKNPKFSNKARLLVFDKFENYYSREHLSNYLEPLFKSNVLDRLEISDLDDSADFIDIFFKIHSNHDYFDYITASKKELPNRPDEKIDEEKLLSISENTLIDAVFVDGCKSWFSTKYFMKEVCKVANIGTYFIFQDYCWYTCFWISAFI